MPGSQFSRHECLFPGISLPLRFTRNSGNKHIAIVYGGFDPIVRLLFPCSRIYLGTGIHERFALISGLVGRARFQLVSESRYRKSALPFQRATQDSFGQFSDATFATCIFIGVSGD